MKFWILLSNFLCFMRVIFLCVAVAQDIHDQEEACEEAEAE